MTTFFIPGIAGGRTSLDRAYRDMSDVIELEMGRRPAARRILRLWTRRGSTDCITEVGGSDPLRGGTVLAISDMGCDSPFVVWRQTERSDGVREILGCDAYAVSEFDS